MADNTTFRVTKVKTDKDGKKFYQEVGRLILRPTGSGVLFLHMFDGDFAVFAKKKGEGDEAQGEPGAEG